MSGWYIYIFVLHIAQPWIAMFDIKDIFVNILDDKISVSVTWVMDTIPMECPCM